MKSASKAVNRRRKDILSALMLLPLIAWEIYEIWLGDLTRTAISFRSTLLLFAFFGALYAAWSVVQFEYFPKFDVFSRRSQVWFTISVDLWCAGLVLLWLEPSFALPVVISTFVIADLMGFQALRELLGRMPHWAGL